MLRPVLAPLENLQMPQIPPQNLRLLPQIYQFQADPECFTCIRGFGRDLGAGFGFIRGDFSKANTPRQEGEKSFIVGAEKELINSKM